MATKKLLSKEAQAKLIKDATGNDIEKAVRAIGLLEEDSKRLKEAIILQFIEGARASIEQGNTPSLLRAVSACLSGGIMAPKWLIKAFGEKVHMVEEAKAKSWDDVFGKLYAKGKHSGAISQSREMAWEVYFMVKNIYGKPKCEVDEEEFPKDKEPNRKPFTKDDGLYEYVGEHFGIGKTLAKRYKDSVEKWIEKNDQGIRERYEELEKMRTFNPEDQE